MSLFAPGWKSGRRSAAQAAVERAIAKGDGRLLELIAMESPYPEDSERAALALTDGAALMRVATGSSRERVRMAALSRIEDEEALLTLALSGAPDKLRRAAVSRIRDEDRLWRLTLERGCTEAALRLRDVKRLRPLLEGEAPGLPDYVLTQLTERLEADEAVLLSLRRQAKRPAVRERALVRLARSFPSEELRPDCLSAAVELTRRGERVPRELLDAVGAEGVLTLLAQCAEAPQSREALPELVRRLPPDYVPDREGCALLCKLLRPGLGSRELIEPVVELLKRGGAAEGTVFSELLLVPDRRARAEERVLERLLELPEDTALDFLLLYMERAEDAAQPLGGPMDIVKTAARGIRLLHSRGRAAERIERELPEKKSFRIMYTYQDSEGDIRDETDSFTETFR